MEITKSQLERIEKILDSVYEMAIEMETYYDTELGMDMKETIDDALYILNEIKED